MKVLIMSKFLKRVIILKSVDGGGQSCILKIESGLSGFSLFLKCDEKFFNENYKLAISDGNDFSLQPVLSDQFCSLDLSDQIIAGIFKKDELIFFGASSPYIDRKTLIDKKKDYEDFIFESEKNLENIYDDDKIATENYYDNRLIDKDLDDEEQTYRNDETSPKDLSTQKERVQSEKTFYDETGFNAIKSQDDFYELQAKSRLSELFSVCEEVECLKSVIPNSRFVKVNYTNSSFYIVGIIEENDKPKYICYGVSGVYGYPPKSLSDFCHFVPKSLFDLSRDGYYMIFQSAKTGEKITPSIDVFGF